MSSCSNFHNFTVDRHFNDRAAQRYLLKMEVRDPVVVNGIEWVSFRFHGQPCLAFAAFDSPLTNN